MRFVVAAAVCGAAFLGQAGAASAYLRDFEHVRLGTPTSSNTFNGRPVNCPAGKWLIGMGGGVPWTSSSYSGLGMTGLWISSANGGNGVVSGAETDPYAPPWHMAAHGYCASFTMTPPSQAPGAAYIRDVRIVSNQTPLNGVASKGVTAGCQGQDSIGGGFYVSGANGAKIYNVTVQTAQLIDGDNYDGYMAHARESDYAFGRPWQLRVWAICATRTPGGSGRLVGNNLTTLDHINPASSAQYQISISHCPNGLRPIGGAAEVISGVGTGPGPASVVLTGSYPVQLSANSWVWVATASEEDLNFRSWRLRSRAVCAFMDPSS